jgi:hypothetical protein
MRAVRDRTRPSPEERYQQALKDHLYCSMRSEEEQTAARPYAHDLSEYPYCGHVTTRIGGSTCIPVHPTPLPTTCTSTPHRGHFIESSIGSEPDTIVTTITERTNEPITYVSGVRADQGPGLIRSC